MRTRICLYILLLAPLATYWQTAFHEFAMRTDYSNLREAREEPGKLVRSTGARGRPLSGAMLEASFTVIDDVAMLSWMRLATILLLTLLAIVLWRQLYQSGWSEIEAAGVGLGIVLLPAAQFVVSWASAWPHALTLILAAAGFSAIETEIERGGLKRIIALLGGCMIYTAAGLIYQTNVLFALVIVTAVLLVRTGREPLGDIKWCAFHVAAVAVGLALSQLLVHLLVKNGVFAVDPLRATENSWLNFFRYPLPNAAAIYALNDDNHTGALIYWGTALGVVTTLVLAYRKIVASSEELVRRRGIQAIVALAVVLVAVCIVSADRIATYRVLFPLSGVVLVLIMHALRVLLVQRKIRKKHYAGMAVIVLALGFLAQHNSHTLLAEPQNVEWETMRGAVLRGNFSKALRVHIIRPGPGDRVTERTYGDEFGSTSSADETLARDMFVAAVHSRFPDQLPKGASYTITTSLDEPGAGSYDLLVDMRKIKRVP